MDEILCWGSFDDEEEPVRVDAGRVTLQGALTVPQHARGLVVCVHGRQSGRYSARNRRIGALLREARLGTLLLDLLTPEEELRESLLVGPDQDALLLAGRLVAATEWARSSSHAGGLPVGYLAGGNGAAVAFIAAGERPELARAIVSRSGEPALSFGHVPLVRAPTLLIVGEHDRALHEVNREAFDRLTCEKDLVVVPRAGRWFDEPEALEAVGALAREWFLRFVVGAGAGS